MSEWQSSKYIYLFSIFLVNTGPPDGFRRCGTLFDFIICILSIQDHRPLLLGMPFLYYDLNSRAVLKGEKPPLAPVVTTYFQGSREYQGSEKAAEESCSELREYIV